MWIDDVLASRVSDGRHDAELWKFDYECRRYLKNVTDTYLDTRYVNLCRNLAMLICELRDAPPIHCHFISTWWWLRKRVHLLEEYRLRNRAVPDSSSLAALSVASRKPLYVPKFPNSNDIVVRYSEEKYLREFVEQGRVRIAPATDYKGEVSEARQDDEKNKHVFSMGDGVRVGLPDGTETPIIGDLKRTTSFTVNYFVLCAANEHDDRLFDFFPNKKNEPAEACAIIWDVDEFAARLERAGRQHLPGWYFHYASIQYFDPYEIERNERVDPGMSKDFLYAYQREYRFLWFPKSGGDAVEPLFLNLGPLSDIARVYRRDGTPI